MCGKLTQESTPAPHPLCRCLVVVLLSIHTTLLVYGAYALSPTADEPAHLAAGLSHWQFGRFDLYRVNPPLVRMIAAIPVLAVRPKTDYAEYYEIQGARLESKLGGRLVEINGSRIFALITIARWMCIPFSLLGATVCYRWAHELAGSRSALVALILWCFCPSVLGHGQLITPDVGATSLGLTATYHFWRWLRYPYWPQSLLVGLLLGLALLTKTTVLLFPIVWFAVWFLNRAALQHYKLPVNHPTPKGHHPPESVPIGFHEYRHHPECYFKQEQTARRIARRMAREFCMLVLMVLVALFILNSGYAFEGSGQRLGDYTFVSRALRGIDCEAENRFAGSWLAVAPIPVPRDYLIGIDVQKNDFEEKLLSYLRGELRNQGWWYYYLYALMIKIPVGTWLIVLWAFGSWLSGRATKLSSPDTLMLLTPAIGILFFVSAQTGFNHHMRYVLPAVPFVFVWTSCVLSQQCAFPLSRAVVGMAASWSVASSLWIYPHSLSYFNEVIGGPLNGSQHLIDSNIDWGQDLCYLAKWSGQQPNEPRLRLAFFGSCNPCQAGIDYALPPTCEKTENALGAVVLTPGSYAISVNLLCGYPWHVFKADGGQHHFGRDAVSYFQQLRPSARVGYSIYIYQIARTTILCCNHGTD